MAPPDDNQTDNTDNPLKALIGVMQKAMGGSGAGASNADQNPLMLIIKAIFTFLSMLLGGDPYAQDFPSDGQQNTEGKQGDFKKSVTDNFKPGTILKVPKELSDMRAGAANEVAIMPVADDVRITSGFGHREAPALAGGGHGSTEHKGLDIAPSVPGSHPDIVAPMSGVVMGAGWINGYGNTVDILDTHGIRHRMAHLQSFKVQVGQEVHQGEKIAVMGNTGEPGMGVHLHYEQRDADGKIINGGPEILGRHLAKGDRIARAESLVAMNRQNSGSVMVADNNTHSAPALGTAAGGYDFSSFSQSNAYAPPASAGGKTRTNGQPARG